MIQILYPLQLYCPRRGSKLEQKTGRLGEISLPIGYRFCSIPRVGRRGGGVALLYKDTLTVTSVTDESTAAFVSLSVCVKSGSSTLHLVVMYRLIPNRKNKLTCKDFLDEFSKLIDKFALASGLFMMAGDFIIHWDVESNPSRKKLHDLLESANLQQHVREPIGPTQRRTLT